eukprot:4279391-Alexandrium_andersonii.AAC.2
MSGDTLPPVRIQRWSMPMCRATCTVALIAKRHQGRHEDEHDPRHDRRSNHSFASSLLQFRAVFGVFEALPARPFRGLPPSGPPQKALLARAGCVSWGNSGGWQHTRDDEQEAARIRWNLQCCHAFTVIR